MLVDLTKEEAYLIVQSIKAVDWEYSEHQRIAESAIRKIAQQAAKIVEREEKEARDAD